MSFSFISYLCYFIYYLGYFNFFYLFILLFLCFSVKFFFFIKKIVISHSQWGERLAFEFKFEKLGLEPNEYKQCLTSKVDSLVQNQSIKIKNLTKRSIPKVLKEVCVRQITSEENPRMDQRYKITKKYIKEGYLRNVNDTFWKYNNETKGKRGVKKKKDEWVEKYHDDQKKLLTATCLASRFDARDVQRILKREMSTEACCNAIDKVTATLIRSDLSKLDKKEVEKVFELCGFNVRGRTAVDWAVENNLFHKNYFVWRNHILMVMSLAALMVVADMTSQRLGDDSPRQKRITEYFSVKTAGECSPTFCVIAAPIYFGAYLYDVVNSMFHTVAGKDHRTLTWVAYGLLCFLGAYVLRGFSKFYDVFISSMLCVFLILSHFFCS